MIAIVDGRGIGRTVFGSNVSRFIHTPTKQKMLHRRKDIQSGYRLLRVATQSLSSLFRGKEMWGCVQVRRGTNHVGIEALQTQIVVQIGMFAVITRSNYNGIVELSRFLQQIKDVLEQGIKRFQRRVVPGRRG